MSSGTITLMLVLWLRLTDAGSAQLHGFASNLNSSTRLHRASCSVATWLAGKAFPCQLHLTCGQAMRSSTWDHHGHDVYSHQAATIVSYLCQLVMAAVERHCCKVSHLVLTMPGAALRAGTQATAKEVKA